MEEEKLNNSNPQDKPKVEKINLADIQSQKDDDLVDRIMQQILKIK